MVRWSSTKISTPRTRKRSAAAIALLLAITPAARAQADDDDAPRLAFLEFLGMASELEQLGVELVETPPPVSEPDSEATQDE